MASTSSANPNTLLWPTTGTKPCQLARSWVPDTS